MLKSNQPNREACQEKSLRDFWIAGKATNAHEISWTWAVTRFVNRAGMENIEPVEHSEEVETYALKFSNLAHHVTKRQGTVLEPGTC